MAMSLEFYIAVLVLNVVVLIFVLLEYRRIKALARELECRIEHSR